LRAVTGIDGGLVVVEKVEEESLGVVGGG